MAAHNVGAVIVDNYRYQLVNFYGGPTPPIPLRFKVGPIERRALSLVASCLNSLGATPQAVSRVTLYLIPPQALITYPSLTAIEMQQRANRARFEALLVAAEPYAASRGDLAKLTPQRVQQLGLAPTDWFGGMLFPEASPNPVFHVGSILGAANSNSIKVGIEGSYDGLAPIIERYSADANGVYFPYPTSLSLAAKSADAIAMLVMTFDRAEFERAPSLARPDLSYRPAADAGGRADVPRDGAH